jgi:translocation and assembly module TamB
MVRLLKWVVKIALVAVAILLVMALGILLFVGLTPVGSQIAAERISSHCLDTGQTG